MKIYIVFLKLIYDIIMNVNQYFIYHDNLVVCKVDNLVKNTVKFNLENGNNIFILKRWIIWRIYEMQ